MRWDSHATEWNVILCKPDKIWVLNPCSTKLQLFQSSTKKCLFFFSISPRQSTYRGSEDENKQATPSVCCQIKPGRKPDLQLVCYNGQRRWDQSPSPKFHLCDQIQEEAASEQFLPEHTSLPPEAISNGLLCEFVWVGVKTSSGLYNS